MDKEEIKKIVNDWIWFDNLKYLDEAIDKTLKENGKIFRRLLNVNHSFTLNTEKLFSDDINVTIKYLQSLKEEGYTSISQEWSGYESNYFVADKYEEETDREYGIRLAKTLNCVACEIMENKEEIEAKNRKIKELQEEINKLKQK